MRYVFAAETSAKPTLWETVLDNAVYVLAFFGIIAVMFLISFALERLSANRNVTGKKEKFFSTKKIAVVGIMSAMAAVLMILDFPIPLIPGGIYKFDFSEIPVMIGAFAYGPATGVVMEFVKIILKLLIKGTSTAFIGELANFVVGCSFVIPAATIYMFNKTKKRAIVACVIGTLCMTLGSMLFNWLYLLPAFVKYFNMPMEAIIGMGTKANSSIVDEASFILLATGPFNLIKGIAISIVTMFIYKPLSRYIIKRGDN